ncbi:MAG: fasciclin domain-containing protein [Bacteroidota bacterium]|nr:fasciclin domain-containing protein [Bacteroidota bacterium]
MKILKKMSAHAFLLATMALLVSCTDSWVDHYEANGQSGEKTLWEALTENEELKEFTSILENAGYDKYLKGDQEYTVWAPKNSINTLLISGADMSDEDRLIQIVDNHIARSVISVSSLTIDTVQMLNGKKKALGHSVTGTAMFDQIPITTKNIICSNGILHIIEHQSPYDNNIWSYIRQDAELTNLSNYLYSFSMTKFDPESSTQSGVKNGQKVYSDSAFYTSNSMWTKLGYINNESYNFWMLAPTNSAWNEALTNIGKYYNYPAGIDTTFHNLYTKLAVVNHLVYQVNRQKSPVDSLTSTTGGIFHSPFAPEGIFSMVFDKVKCSNGTIFKTSSLLMKPEETFVKTIVVEAENSDYVIDKLNCATTDAAVMVNAANIRLSNNRYMKFTPVSSKLRPNVTFALPNTLSGTYDIGVVFVPQNLTRNGWTTTVDQLPALVSLTLTDANDQSSNGYISLASDTVSASKMDTAWVTKGHKFPKCDYFPDNIPSKAKVTLNVACIVKPSQTAAYTRNLYIDCIVLKPTIK